MADNERKPMVVNISLNGHSDPHDGTDTMARAIEDFCGSRPGRAVCVSAGNDARFDIHRGGTLNTNQSVTLSVEVPNGPAVTNVHLNCWLDKTSGIQFTVTPPAPAGRSTDRPFTFNARNWDTTPLPKLLFGTDEVNAAVRDGPNPAGVGGEHSQLALDIKPVQPTTRCTPGVWQVRLVNQGKEPRTYDAWVVSNNRHGVVRFNGTGATERLRIGAPGTAAHALTVAGYVSSVAWTDAGGTPRTGAGSVGAICPFSSPGPSRTNSAVNPDFAAPGAYIRAALSRQARAVPTMTLGGGFHIVTGTSFAAPSLVGLVALLLQRNPSLNARDVEQILRAAAVRPPGTPALLWGAGVVDAGLIP